jgi:hypothetical protein
MAIADAASDYINTDGPRASGANSVTDVVIPTNSIALIAFHYYTGSDGYAFSSVTLDSQSATLIATENDGAASQHLSVWWVSGASAGSGKTLAYSLSGAIGSNIGISISFLTGTETTAAIRGFDQTSAYSDPALTGISFVSGDWTMLAYTSDPTCDPTNSSANTAIIPKSAITTTGAEFGQVYKTDNGNIGIAGTGIVAAIVGFTVKEASSGSIVPQAMANYRMRAA